MTALYENPLKALRELHEALRVDAEAGNDVAIGRVASIMDVLELIERADQSTAVEHEMRALLETAGRAANSTGFQSWSYLHESLETIVRRINATRSARKPK